MAKKQTSDDITVEFTCNYVAERGAGISGAKGDVKTYPTSDQVKKLVSDGVLKPVKAAGAATREKATTD